jgi:hypothetical protein
MHGDFSMRTIKAVVICAVSLVLSSLSAQSADLNFDPIAVNVTQLYSEVTRIEVACDTKDDAGKWMTGVTYVQAANTANPSWGNLDATKSFSGNVQWGLNFNNPADQANTKTYVCRLRLWCSGQCSGNATGVIREAEVGDESEWWHVKGGTLQIEGPIWPGYPFIPVKTIEAVGHSRY